MNFVRLGFHSTSLWLSNPPKSCELHTHSTPESAKSQACGKHTRWKRPSKRPDETSLAHECGKPDWKAILPSDHPFRPHGSNRRPLLWTCSTNGSG